MSDMHVYMKQQLVADRVAELQADAQRASEASRAPARRKWRVLVQALLAR